MADITIFDDEAFSVSSLTASINEGPSVPSKLGDSGLFDEDGVNTTTVEVEKDGNTLSLVSAAERGSQGMVVTGGRRFMLPFKTVHLPQTGKILADEIRGIRAFGSTTELEAVSTVVEKRLRKMRQQLDATHEFHRIGAIKGQVLDADGQRVLIDLYRVFEIEQLVVDFDLDSASTEVRTKCTVVLDHMEDELGGTTFTGARVYCGRGFWAALIEHRSVKETYLATQMAGALRADGRESFEFGGIVWERYRGKVGGISFIGDDDAYAVPEGVPDLFITRFAPADYMETVNTLGLPYYAKQEPMRMNKGVDLEVQSNPLHINTRPRAVIKLTK